VGSDKPKDAHDIVWFLEAWPPEVRKEQPPSSKRASPSSAPTSKPRSSDWQSSLAMSHCWARAPSLASPRHRTFAERGQKKAGTPLSPGIWPSNFGFLLF